MYISPTASGIPWIYHFQQRLFNGSEKIQTITNWSTPWTIYDVICFFAFANFYQMFIKNYFQVCSCSTDLFNMQKQVRMKAWSEERFSKSKVWFYDGCNFDPTKLLQTFLYEDWDFGFCIGSSIITNRRRTKTSSSCILFDINLNCINQLQDSQQITPRYYKLVFRMSSLFWKHLTLGDCIYRSQKSWIFHICSCLKLSPNSLEHVIITLQFHHYISAKKTTRIIICLVSKEKQYISNNEDFF